MNTTHAKETTEETAAREARENAAAAAEKSAAAAAHDAKVVAARAKETPKQRAEREASETANHAEVARLAEVEQCRIELNRAEDNYQQSIAGTIRKLQTLAGGTGDAAAKAAKALADEYEIEPHPRVLIQPTAPKGPSPFAEKAK